MNLLNFQTNMTVLFLSPVIFSKTFSHFYLPKDPNEKICYNPNIRQLQSQML